MVTCRNLPDKIETLVEQIEENQSERQIRVLFTHEVLGLAWQESLVNKKTGKVHKLYVERAREMDKLQEGLKDMVNLGITGSSKVALEVAEKSKVVFHSGHYASQLVVYKIEKK